MSIWQLCGLERNMPRTCTPENAKVATNVDNSESPVTLVAALAIDPLTKQVDFSHSIPIESDLANTAQVRENMQQLLAMILAFFEEEQPVYGKDGVFQTNTSKYN